MIKKLMSKKANIFGKQVSVFVIALIAVIGIASAALVPYLSGLITGNVVVESPLELQISADGALGSWSDAINLDPIHGGESVTFYTQETNHRKVAVPADMVITIDDTGNAEDGWTDCDELTSIMARTTDDSWSGNLKTLTSCDDTTTPNVITLTLHKDVAVGTYEYEITPTFNLNAVGTYEVTVQFK